MLFLTLSPWEQPSGLTSGSTMHQELVFAVMYTMTNTVQQPILVQAFVIISHNALPITMVTRLYNNTEVLYHEAHQLVFLVWRFHFSFSGFISFGQYERHLLCHSTSALSHCVHKYKAPFINISINTSTGETVCASATHTNSDLIMSERTDTNCRTLSAAQPSNASG